MNSTVRIDNRDPPYVYNMYNVRCFMSNPLSHIHSVPGRMVNCLIKAIHDKECVRIPRFVVVIPDWDILRYFNHNTFGIEKITEETIEWMMSEMVKAVEDKREQLFKIKPGAVISTEPKYVWIKMMQHMAQYDKVLTVRAKYNNTLESILADRSGHYVIDVNPILRDPAYFTGNNELNAEGRILFWKEVDECIHLFDRRKLTLKPRKNPRDTTAPKSDSAAELRFRLLPPPPRKKDKSGNSSFHHRTKQDQKPKNRHHDKNRNRSDRR